MSGAAVAVLLAVAGCTSPSFGNGHLQCAANGRACPSGFYCAGDGHCWRTGTSPPSRDLADDLASGGDLATLPSRCAGLNVLLCDGFEAATLDAQWMPQTTLGSVALDATRAFRGTTSLHLHHDATAATTRIQAGIRETRTFPIATTIYLRAWMYFSTPAFPPNIQALQVNDTAGGGVSYVIDHGHPGVNDYFTPPSYGVSASTLVPIGRWTCLQLDITQTGTSGTINVSLDGTLIDVSPWSGTTGAVAGATFSLGLYMPPALPAEDLWLDEVIVDNKPTTCAE